MTEIIINYWAVLACGVAAMILGFIWYNPSVLGKQWMAITGMSPDSASKSEMQRMYTTSFILALIMAYVLSHVLQAFETTGVAMSLQGAFWTWLGFVVPTSGVNYLYTKKPLKLFAIDSGYHLANLLVMSVILTVWS